MQIVHCKILSGCVMFLVTLVCGCGPFILLRRLTDRGDRRRHRVASRLNSTQAFACGVFIGTCLLHLLPEASEDIHNSLSSDLPVSEMIVAFGFLLLLVTENLILACHERSGSANGEKDKEGGRSAIVVPDEDSVNNQSRAHERKRLTDDSLSPQSSYGTMSDDQDIPNGRNGSSNHTESQTDVTDPDKKRNDIIIRNEQETAFTDSSTTHSGGQAVGGCGRGYEPNSAQAKPGSPNTADKGEDREAKRKKAVLKSFVLLFALSLHTVFDGLVVGLQDKQSELWTLLAAVSIHKALISVSIALSLLDSHRHHPRASLLYLSVFSLVAPAGLTAGIMLTETHFDTHAQTLTSGVLQSVATGTFMYVTFVESLKGRFEGQDRLQNTFLLLLGFGMVCGLRVAFPG